MFNATNSNAIISKPKNIFSIFLCISGIYIKFWILSKKSWVSQVISYWNYRLQKSELLKSSKSLVSEHLWTVNMLKGSKDCLNLHGSIFCHTFWSLWDEFRSRNLVLIVSEILRHFVNILTPDEKYCLSVKAKV